MTVRTIAAWGSLALAATAYATAAAGTFLTALAALHRGEYALATGYALGVLSIGCVWFALWVLDASADPPRGGDMLGEDAGG